ncbi:hypothetical protein ABZ353_35950 [Streptomyces niveus]|uniref:hypothetical protein n=1 Tax=Streptomyces niveus TaxID=193462 RepID=UPI0033EC4A11
MALLAVLTVGPAGNPAAAEEQRTPGAKTCSAVPAAKKSEKSRAATQCIEFVTRDSTSTRSVDAVDSPVRAQNDETPDETCAAAAAGEWSATRKTVCLNGAKGIYTLYDSTGKSIGTGLMDVYSSAATQHVNTNIKEQITITVTQLTGDVKSLNFKAGVNCRSTCKTTVRQPWIGTKTLLQGETVTGEVAYSSSVATDAEDFFALEHNVFVTSNGATPVDTGMTWTTPDDRLIKCDGYSSTGYPRGCVVNIPATLTFDVDDPQNGGAIAVYKWVMGQRNSSWLTREGNDMIAEAHRNRTCGSFIKRPDLVPVNEECDEFPMAKTVEGGQAAMYCADVFPEKDASGNWGFRPVNNETWETMEGKDCATVHISQTVNGSLGGKYGSFVQVQRVQDQEKFKVEFSR